jgi:NAD(P)-dependent dehydrogenase (short-subunit alcohol dehydrogenase family)
MQEKLWTSIHLHASQSRKHSLLYSSDQKALLPTLVVLRESTPRQGMYGASCAAVNYWSDILRNEIAPFGVKVILVSLFCPS